MGKKITLVEYAKRHGKAKNTVRRKARDGNFKTAEKIGRDWFIDEDEPYIDYRVKSGKYKNWRNK
jgi:hypothetical protein